MFIEKRVSKLKMIIGINNYPSTASCQIQYVGWNNQIRLISKTKKMHEIIL